MYILFFHSLYRIINIVVFPIGIISQLNFSAHTLILFVEFDYVTKDPLKNFQASFENKRERMLRPALDGINTKSFTLLHNRGRIFYPATMESIVLIICRYSQVNSTSNNHINIGAKSYQRNRHCLHCCSIPLLISVRTCLQFFHGFSLNSSLLLILLMVKIHAYTFLTSPLLRINRDRKFWTLAIIIAKIQYLKE